MYAVRLRLLWKLLAVQALLLIAALAVAWWAVDTLAAESFMTLMKRFSIEPGEVEAMFRSSTRTALIQVGIAALLVAALLSYWMTRRILLPLDRLAEGSERIAAGDYGFRIDTRRGVPDELDHLVHEFNTMATALERIERARKAMVVDVAHELRTPLTNLRGTVEAMQDGLLPLDREALTALHEELLRLVRLTEDLVEAGRASAGNHVVRRVETDLRALLGRTVELFRARLMSRELVVETGLDELAVPVRTDPDQMQQVFSNLLQNAVQFSPPGRVIRIFAERREQGVVRIVFENRIDGVDLSEEELERVFEPYYRLESSRAREGGGGAGLGLAIVRGLVAGHGGRVGANTVDDSIRVWIELPTT